METILEYVNNLLAEVLVDMRSGTGQYVGTAKIIASLGATVSSFMTFGQIMSGKSDEPITSFFRRLLLISLAIAYYNTFLGLINMPLDAMGGTIKEVVTTDHGDAKSFFDSYDFNKNNEFSSNAEADAEINELLREADSQTDDAEAEEEGSTSSVIMSIFNGSYQDNIRLWILEAIYDFIHFLGVIAIIVLNVVRTFFLIVLSIFGIFVLAFSMYPGLENSFNQWLQKYINVYLWLPISYILQGLISKLFMKVKPDVASTIFTATSEEIANSSNNVVIALIGICSVVSFATVPTLSSWLINAATNALGSKVKGKAMDVGKTAQQAGKAAAAVKTGGASALAGAAVGK
ncbi:MAG: type IV secretion system protein [Bacteroidota bacterium]